MLINAWYFVLEWFRERSQRIKLIRNFNEASEKAFIEGISPTLLRARVSRGERAYRHQFSDWLNSGFRIQAFTGRMLTKSELTLIGNVILSDKGLVRQLIVLGFDTLEIHSDRGSYGCKWQIKDQLQLGE